MRPKRVPVQVVVHDDVAVLEVQALRHDIRGDEDVDLGVTLPNEVRVRLRREARRHESLALVGPVDDLDGALHAPTDLDVEILGGVRVLREDEALPRELSVEAPEELL
jgi:hypothetical protein